MLHAKIMINSEVIGEVQITRREDMPPDGFDANAVNHYDWKCRMERLGVDPTSGWAFAYSGDHPVSHRYGDGALSLMANVLKAIAETLKLQSSSWELTSRGQ